MGNNTQGRKIPQVEVRVHPIWATCDMGPQSINIFKAAARLFLSKGILAETLQFKKRT